MNLSKLFEMQRVLDAKIIKEKGLEDMDRLPYLILALQVELGECANEWRGFKYWSEDQEPRRSKHTLKKEYQHLHITQTGAYEYQLRDEFGKVVFDDVTDHHHDHTNPLLEEYVDCLHFILSIGLHLHIHPDYLQENIEGDECSDVIHQFLHIFDKVGDMSKFRNSGNYARVFEGFIVLGEMLGFDWEQIEKAYMDKNAVNHERQSTGY
jgi:dimeric dUTPase (all-alpha-NTP-PPase superfamily)